MDHRMPHLKTGWPSLNAVVFPSVMGLVMDDPNSRANLGTPSAVFLLNQYLSNWTSHVSWLGSPLMKILTCGSFPPSGSRNA
jgi:hypothetical protein